MNDASAFHGAMSPRPAPTLAIVVPCYNEESVLPETASRLRALVHRMQREGLVTADSRIWFVDDGSSDATWSLIAEAARDRASGVCGIKLSRNRGHQVALLAGLMSARGDALVSVDADLQDDLEAIPAMVRAFREGHDIVYGVRSARDTDTAFKRGTAEGYYRLLDRLGVEIVFNHADYRLMSRRSVEALRSHPESNLFLRGMIPQLGFPATTVSYARAERFAGESKYPLRKMLALAWQGVTSFSTTPLRMITIMGVTVSAISVVGAIWALLVRLFTDASLPGWASITIPLFFLSGVQLLSLGVIGEYLGKVFVETKRRPHYFLDQVVGDQGGQPTGGAHHVTLPDAASDSVGTFMGTAAAVDRR